MKQWLITILLVGLAGLLIVGCEVEQLVQDVQQQATDPCSPVQIVAGKLQEMIKPAVILVQTAEVVAGFPYAKVILSAFAAIQLILNIILGWRNKNTNKALTNTTGKLKAANQGMDLFRIENPDKAAELYNDVGDARERIGVGI